MGTRDSDGIRMGTRDPAHARKGLGMPTLAETGSRDPSVHRWGTRDTAAIGMGTQAGHQGSCCRRDRDWESPTGSPSAMGTGTHTATGTGNPGTCRQGTEHADVTWMGTRDPSTHRQRTTDPDTVGMETGNTGTCRKESEYPNGTETGTRHPSTCRHQGPREDKIWGLQHMQEGDLDAMGTRIWTAARAEPGPRALVPWGHGLGTSAHAGRGLETPAPWGQLTPSVPAPGTPQQGLFGTQTPSTTMRPRVIVPPLCNPNSQLVQQSPSKERPKCWGHAHFAFPRSRATFPLNYLQKSVHVGQSEKTNLVNANQVPKAKTGARLWGHRNNLRGLCSGAAQPFPA